MVGLGDFIIVRLWSYLVNFGKVYTKYAKNPYVKNNFYKLYREYNKTRKMKRRIYKSNLLHEFETLNEDNPKMYWKMINELQKKPRQILIIIIVFPPPDG